MRLVARAPGSLVDVGAGASVLVNTWSPMAVRT